MLDTGYLMLDARYSILDARPAVQAINIWYRVAGMRKLECGMRKMGKGIGSQEFGLRPIGAGSTPRREVGMRNSFYRFRFGKPHVGLLITDALDVESEAGVFRTD